MPGIKIQAVDTRHFRAERMQGMYTRLLMSPHAFTRYSLWVTCMYIERIVVQHMLYAQQSLQDKQANELTP
jgi:hypothetical protein